MSTRRITGLVAGLAGLLITVAHLALALFSGTPERYHGHEAVVAIGVVLTLAGVMLMGGADKR